MIPFLILLFFELARNWYSIVKLKRSPHKARGWAFRFLVILFIAFFKFDLELQDVVIFGMVFSLPVTTILYSVGSAMAFWFPFDVILNLIRTPRKAWNYLGQNSVLDRFNLPGDLEWVIKFVLMCAGIWHILSI